MYQKARIEGNVCGLILCVAISPKKEKKVILLKKIILVCQEQVYLPTEECQFCWYSWKTARDGMLAQVRTHV